MKTWTVKYLPSGESWSGFEQGGFASYDEAYAWLRNNGFCPECKKSKQRNPDCLYEWMIFEKEEEENSSAKTFQPHRRRRAGVGDNTNGEGGGRS